MDITWSVILCPQLFIATIGFAVYSYVLYVILSSKSTTFSSAFFRIFVFTGFCNLITVVSVTYVHVESQVGLGPDFELLSRIMVAVAFTGFYTHVFGSLLLTVNRFIGICCPELHRVITREAAIRWILFADVAISFGITSLLYFTNLEYVYDNGWKTVRDDSFMVHRIICASIVVAYELVSISLISVTLYTLHRHAKKNNRRGHELGLIALTAVSSLISALEALYDISLAMHLQANGLLLWIQEQFDCIYTGMMTIHAYGIIIMSGTVRSEMLRRWRTKQTATSTPVFVVKTTITRP
ncbi:hypothetical protein Q1695_014868 [Nippostrongylus brasiliensis]|nr:hypothetical protein Q1695_014868 [Nippostrongylus brasiliensis]